MGAPTVLLGKRVEIGTITSAGSLVRIDNVRSLTGK
jgi:hypothetical protein